MSPKVRLPLVDVTEATKRDVAAKIAQMRADCAEELIGKLLGPECESRQPVAC